MTNTEIMEALRGWVGQVVPDVAGKVYTAPPANKDLGLPDCAIVLVAEEPGLDPEQFPWVQLQQVGGYTLRLALSFMVEVGLGVAAEEAADLRVRGYAEAIKRRCHDESQTLGPREIVGRAPTFGYEPPFVEYEDGTRGREMTVTLAVAQLL